MRLVGKVFWVPAGMVLLVLLAACSGGDSEGKAADGSAEGLGGEDAVRVVVASKIDTEGALLGSMMVQLLREEGFDVVDKTQFGPTDVIRKAIQSGEVDLYPEYTGNGAFFFPESSSGVWKDPEEGFAAVKRLDRETNGLVWLEPAPANNTWALAVREDLAEAEGLVSLADLAGYLRGGGEFKLAASEEFVTREDVLPAFEEAYGFELSEDQLLTFSSGNTARTEKAAARRTDGVNAAMAYGTDGQLSALNLRVLEDGKNVMPIYRPAPVVRGELYEEAPEIAEILGPLFSGLDRETLQTLNARIAVEGVAPSQVAGEYLKQLP